MHQVDARGFICNPLKKNHKTVITIVICNEETEVQTIQVMCLRLHNP